VATLRAGFEAKLLESTEFAAAFRVSGQSAILEIIIIFSKLCRFGGPRPEFSGCMWLHLLVACGCIVGSNVKQCPLHHQGTRDTAGGGTGVFDESRQ
jgi:hypothetical protein